MDRPTIEDRSKFVEQVVDTIFSIPKVSTRKSKEPASVPELQKAPKEQSGPKTSELRAKVEAEQHALRRLRMCLRDVCNRYAVLSYFRRQITYQLINCDFSVIPT